jgi:4-hydroxyacetophenone monooxygenase
MAIKLQEAGIPYVIYEKNSTVGGTWLENSYPGCGVDTPNHFYSLSFEPNHDWPDHFSKRDELHYLERLADLPRSGSTSVSRPSYRGALR